ncbi:hypothetical protein QQF64_007861 [Cirrhinus molitorella]|uniref:Uncharacterized protein n=1 Tax=Cirrhinus molitorella TaxID=172907 RepID=A0ABR3M7L1_9TELE
MVLIQGNEASLQDFEKSFPLLKQTVEEETPCSVKEEPEDENELLPCSPVNTSSTPSVELRTEHATHASSYLQCLPEKMALLEIEVSELKQLILSRPDEFTINNLKAEIKDLHNINMTLKAEMSKMKEDSIQRERKTPATQASVVLLMDSIGKNIEPKTSSPDSEFGRSTAETQNVCMNCSLMMILAARNVLSFTQARMTSIV